MDTWVRVLDGDEEVGWIPMGEAVHLGLAVRRAERPPLWRESDYVGYHAEMCAEMGLLKGDLNPLRRMLLNSVLYRRSMREAEAERIRFEREMLVNNTKMFDLYMRQREDEERREEIEGADIEWRVPESEDELAAFMKEFAEAAGDEEDEELLDDVYGYGDDRPTGAVATVLSDDDWRSSAGDGAATPCRRWATPQSRGGRDRVAGSLDQAAVR